MSNALVLTLLPLFLSPVLSTSEPLPGADSALVAWWRFEDASVSLSLDSSPAGNHASAFGTSLVPGWVGQCRGFNGLNDWLEVSDPSNGSLDFGTETSFAIDFWVKTTALDGIFIRKGLAPVPGYIIQMINGRVFARIGNRADSVWPDTLLTISSSLTINNGAWHHVRLLRDRAEGVIELTVDGLVAASPIPDPITFSLENDRPLTIGRWEHPSYPSFFQGLLDEVRIVRFNPRQVPDDTLALWPLDNVDPLVVPDISPFGNHGTAIGTSSVPGYRGLARQFNGTTDYVHIPYRWDSSLSLDSTESVSLQTWFRTSMTGYGIIMRRGLAPVPGYQLFIRDGSVGGVIGNRDDGLPPDTLLTLLSLSRYDDDTWHFLQLVRDREREFLCLYVDGVPAALPVADQFPYSLRNERSLTLGRWESSAYPNPYQGLLDEPGILRGARHPAGALQPYLRADRERLQFPKTLVGDSVSLPLHLLNFSVDAAVTVSSIASTHSVFEVTGTAAVIAPARLETLIMWYTPGAAGYDTATVVISCDDPSYPVQYVHLEGSAYESGPTPTIISITDIPDDQGGWAAVTWTRTSGDGTFDSSRTVDYGLWRRADLPVGQTAWDFIVTVPAAGLDRYRYVAPTLVDSSAAAGVRWSVFMVSARSAAGPVFFSPPDSGYSVDNISPAPPRGLTVRPAGTAIKLQWEPAVNSDVESYTVYGNSVPGMIPSGASRRGTTSTPTFVDASLRPPGQFYYAVASVDRAGNEGPVSDLVPVFLTHVTPDRPVPANFSLYQNYPNPFNPSSTFGYDVPEPAYVTIAIFDLLGREVQRPVDEYMSAGRYYATVDAASLSSGVYFYRMVSGPYVSTRRFVIMK